ncbi:hypothetical protein CERZMDRAFT_91991 [Cercospora zeae-maydis SCOH1-5]|uniref:Uncharacterized protein n=1 Tax=Cercospora zeae-maydis SCOH1-5 TaxID=717836 RepID=A0A6A6EZ90_9PEZI|nr:hypothetical protein CERZMDRAFT_91991 [Cercospora zeae-maydis SCOH1-5]
MSAAGIDARNELLSRERCDTVRRSPSGRMSETAATAAMIAINRLQSTRGID